jgi:hypothetical protein
MWSTGSFSLALTGKFTDDKQEELINFKVVLREPGIAFV